ncbi:hypothetical protein QE373_002246 [Stenotrophomonas sp. SORGH_AS321]|nr:hypothetical protein [Stenotrophomonas sp. SORGH_AS_0321]
MARFCVGVANSTHQAIDLLMASRRKRSFFHTNVAACSTTSVEAKAAAMPSSAIMSSMSESCVWGAFHAYAGFHLRAESPC